MQLQLASLYPGLLDGIQPSCTYPDSYSTGMEVGDCVMLDNYFASPEFAALTKELTPAQVAAKKAAIAGHLDEKACRRMGHCRTAARTILACTRIRARTSRPTIAHLLDSQVYDAAKNPDGVRCTIAEYAIATWGADARHAHRAPDERQRRHPVRA